MVPLVFAAVVGSAFADGVSDEPVTRSFDSLDANGDGMVSRDEAALTPGLEDSFDQLDANADGVLSRDEIGVGGPSLEAVPESGPAASEPDTE
jgi:Ca2+-binding EF-hand superfamily protein